MFPADTRWRSSTPAMIASAITPAPTTPSVDPRSGLICGLYELDLPGLRCLTDERMFDRLTQNCGRCRRDHSAELPPGRVAGGDRSLPPAAEDESGAPGARGLAEGDPPCDGPPRAGV